jgi:hypothetical protein
MTQVWDFLNADILWWRPHVPTGPIVCDMLLTEEQIAELKLAWDKRYGKIATLAEVMDQQVS